MTGVRRCESRHRSDAEEHEMESERHGERLIMPYYGNGSGLTGRDINRPIGTIATLDPGRRWPYADAQRRRGPVRTIFPGRHAAPGQSQTDHAHGG